MRPVRLVLFGAPGVGKGTQAAALHVRCGVPHLSTGDMLRAAIREGTRLGLEARSIVERGGLVPDELISDMMGERLQANDVKNGFILDGFPRTIAQAHYLDRALAGQGRALDRVVNLVVDEAEIAERLGGRRSCGQCGANYHVTFKPPRTEGVCDACGGALVRRADDAPEVIEERLRVYAGQTEPVLGHYRALGLLQNVDGRGEPSVVTDRILEALRGAGR
jgi:adenylate kinase